MYACLCIALPVCLYMCVHPCAYECPLVCLHLAPTPHSPWAMMVSKRSGQTEHPTGVAAIFKAHLLMHNVLFRLDRNASVAWKQLRSGPARRVRKHLGRQAGVIHAWWAHSSEFSRSLEGILKTNFCCSRSLQMQWTHLIPSCPTKWCI